MKEIEKSLVFVLIFFKKRISSNIWLLNLRVFQMSQKYLLYTRLLQARVSTRQILPTEKEK